MSNQNSQVYFISLAEADMLTTFCCLALPSDWPDLFLTSWWLLGMHYSIFGISGVIFTVINLFS